MHLKIRIPKKALVLLLVLITAVLGGVYYSKQTNKNPLPENIRGVVSYKVIYPSNAKQIDPKSFNYQTDKKTLSFKVNTVASNVVFTEQKAPDALGSDTQAYYPALGIHPYAQFKTIKIRYQTTGVINLSKKTDEFLLNINGRGWDQPFSKVDSTLYVPSSFGGNLKSEPLCYVVLGTSSNGNCRLKTKKSPQETVITASASALAAHQALVVKLQFKPTTFTNKHAVSTKKLLLISAALISAGMVGLVSYLRKSGLSGKKL
jgi:hypothetical protein